MNCKQITTQEGTRGRGTFGKYQQKLGALKEELEYRLCGDTEETVHHDTYEYSNYSVQLI